MKIIKDIKKMKDFSERTRADGKIIGFVPTMGYLHDGHLRLIRLARKKSDIVVVSIYVNPKQFGPKEDFKRYPRDLKRDIKMAKEAGCDVLFCPLDREMYSPSFLTHVEVEELSEKLCGFFRPGHFRGVTTVVTKLFNIVKPHIAIFGQKDAQQAVIIRRMVDDLNFDVKVIVAPTVREKDGLAMSSRNTYLSSEERRKATILFQSLCRAKEIISSGERKSENVIREMKRMIDGRNGISIKYVSVVDGRTLEDKKIISGDTLIALRASIGNTNLIDNIRMNVRN